MRLVLALATLSGCFLAKDDGLTDTRGDQHTLTVHWTLQMPDGSPAPCPDGFGNLLLSSTTDEQSAQVQTLVPCQSSGTQAIALYTSGEHEFKMDGDPDTVYSETFTPNYNEIVYVTDPTGAIPRARSLTVEVTLDHDQDIDVVVYPDAGQLLLSWELLSGTTDAFAPSCEAVAVDQLELQYRLFTPDGDPPAPTSTVRWPCDQKADGYYLDSYAVGQGFTAALAPNDYVGSLVGYRAGVEVGRNDAIAFNIQTGGALTETTDDVTIPDR